jgi:hypothetical protein
MSCCKKSVHYIQSQDSPCGICGGQSCTGRGMATSFSVVPSNNHSVHAACSQKGVLDDAAVPKDLDPPNFTNIKTLSVESEINSYRNFRLQINLYSPHFCRK